VPSENASVVGHNPRSSVEKRALNTHLSKSFVRTDKVFMLLKITQKNNIAFQMLLTNSSQSHLKTVRTPYPPFNPKAILETFFIYFCFHRSRFVLSLPHD